MSSHTCVFVTIKELSDEIKKTFIGAKVITYIVNSNYIKETKKFNNYYTSPIGVIIDKRLYTIEQLSKHCKDDMKRYILNIKRNWDIMFKANHHHSVWALSCDTVNVKAFNDHEYYPTQVSFITQPKIINKLMEVKEFNVDVDFDDDIALARGSSSDVVDEDDIDA